MPYSSWWQSEKETNKEKELKKRTGTPGPSCHRITLTGYDRSDPYGNERQGNRKLLQATSDKTEINKKALQWKKSFVEVNKILGTSSPKKKKNK